MLSNRQPVNNISDASADPLAIPQVNEVVGNNTRGSLSTVIFMKINELYNAHADIYIINRLNIIVGYYITQNIHLKEARWSLIATDFGNPKAYENIEDFKLQGLEQRTQELDTFLSEYRNLQLQLITMRRACDTLRQENLQKDMELLRASILSTSSTSNIKPSALTPPATSVSINEGNRNILTKPILKNRSAVSA